MSCADNNHFLEYINAYAYSMLTAMSGNSLNLFTLDIMGKL